MAIFGSSGRRAATSCSVFLLSTYLAAPALAQSRAPEIHIAATTLDVALTTLARQTGVEIVSTEPGLRSVRTRPLNGRLLAREALRRLLERSGYRAVALNGGGYRVTAHPLAKPHSSPQSVAAPAQPPTPGASPEIVVSASKQHVPLLRFPGSLAIVDLDAFHAIGVNSLDELARVAPVVQATQLGPGRDKLFVRGIADSSFNGATQSTASVYFGDVQLGYSGADPGLQLVDIQRLEVMEGPQGTLYGAGSVGGVIRITPTPVDLERIGGEASAAAVLTAGGAPGFESNAVLNLPIATGTAGFRLVGYRNRDGGYIDDVARGLHDINRVDTIGGRLAFRAEPGDGWSVDTGVLGQLIDGQDGQYAQTGVGALARESALAQPFSDSIALGRLVVTKHWDSGLELISATGIAHYHSLDVFDASGPLAPGPLAPLPAGPSVYRNTLTNLLLTEEARLSRTLPSGMSWVVGFALLRDGARQDREFGPVGSEHTIIGVTNIARSASAFGEVTVAATPALSATFGLRLTTAGNMAQPSSQPSSGGYFSGQNTTRVDPTVAVSWLIAPRLSAFARYQSGYRTGGLAVARGVGRTAEFAPDDIRTGEAGIRYLPLSPRAPTFSAAVSYAYWRNIQADLIARSGQPYTTNIGDARIYTAELNGAWSPVEGLRGTIAAVYTYNLVSGPLADTSVRLNRRLPQTPSFAGDAAIDYSWRARSGDRWHIGSSAHYVGRAVLGTGDFLDVSHDPYFLLGASGGWNRGPWGVTLTLDNLLNAKADRFPFGNPFTLAQRNQTTPLRPLSAKLGVSYSW